MKFKNEHGRSMVEMLGVLAVVGVLSIGGVVGYRYAMERIIENKALVLIDKFLLGYLSESEHDDSVLYESTRTKFAADTASIGTDRFTRYFNDFYGIDFDCSRTLRGFCVSDGFMYGVNPYYYAFEDKWYLELFLGVPQSVCETVMKRLILDEKFAPAIERFGYGTPPVSLNSIGMDEISSHCSRQTSMSWVNGYKKHKGLGFSFIFPY